MTSLLLLWYMIIEGGRYWHQRAYLSRWYTRQIGIGIALLVSILWFWSWATIFVSWYSVAVLVGVFLGGAGSYYLLTRIPGTTYWYRRYRLQVHFAAQSAQLFAHRWFAAAIRLLLLNVVVSIAVLQLVATGVLVSQLFFIFIGCLFVISGILTWFRMIGRHWHWFAAFCVVPGTAYIALFMPLGVVWLWAVQVSIYGLLHVRITLDDLGLDQ